MGLGDALVITRQILLADAAVVALIDDRVYATPVLPVDHAYPLIRLSHIGQAEHTAVGFRQGAVAQIQLDVWSYDQSDCMAIAEASLDALHGMSPVPGAIYIRPTFEAREIDETAQPPLHRYRADLAVKLVRLDMSPLGG